MIQSVDYLVCKKNYGIYDDDDDCILTKGKSYRVFDITEDGYRIVDNDNDEYNLLTSYYDDNLESYVWKLFYKPSEIRQKKLKTILL